MCPGITASRLALIACGTSCVPYGHMASMGDLSVSLFGADVVVIDSSDNGDVPPRNKGKLSIKKKDKKSKRSRVKKEKSDLNSGGVDTLFYPVCLCEQDEKCDADCLLNALGPGWHALHNLRARPL